MSVNPCIGDADHEVLVVLSSTFSTACGIGEGESGAIPALNSSSGLFLTWLDYIAYGKG